MAPDLRASTDTLVTRYGSIQNIPEDVLNSHGYVRFHRQTQGGLTIVDADWPKKAKGLSVWMQKKYAGYLFADHLRRLYHTVKGTDLVLNRDLARMQRRAKAFIEAGIPPIFDKRFSVGYPLIDFLVQYATGSYERRAAGKVASNATQHLNPATIEDVRLFRSVAFLQDGTIEEPLIREILFYCEKTYNFKSDETRTYVLSQTEAGMRFLGEILRDLPHEQRQYVDVLPGHEEAAISRRRWYLPIRPDKREGIVRTFLAILEQEETAKRLEVLHQRLLPIFPEWCAEFSTENRALKRADRKQAEYDAVVAKAVAELVFDEVPPVCFTREPWATPLTEALMRRAALLVTDISPRNFQNLAVASRSTMCILLGLRSAVPLPKACYEFLHAYREKRLRQMDDAEFTKSFPYRTSPMRAGALIAAMSGINASEVAYWHWVRDRVNRLRHD